MKEGREGPRFSSLYPPANARPLTAEARLVRAGQTLVHSDVRVTDPKGRLVATLATSGFRLHDHPAAP